ncbi:hypothetical protein SDRG_06855 [Saprolegnia diclina VS20]|uniref:Uncharacterized protein n=1 Tax=Saprolegnia diclina (strain VS20) TaxID=1156394 RepID=T0QLI1_SAPDV|nr:hypothetical protein SDRG_06855 [Saprolegnia diclina VS20]EQC35566.1 hypothetical protein SDRG_06855 [Saprolegnia diclina VS20]|eukprot:XP_008610883.1 hypothetical protein SDRG_06855 [Saprolegnia diclina VS20]
MGGSTKTLARKAQDEPQSSSKRKRLLTDEEVLTVEEMACWFILPSPFASVLDDALRFLELLPPGAPAAAAIAEIQKLRALEPHDFQVSSTVAVRPAIQCAHEALDHAVTWISSLPVENLGALRAIVELRREIPEHDHGWCLV